jgi:TM2 domain-containing membrane protein YozV
MKPFQKREFRRAMWAALARIVSVSLSAGAGSFLYHIMGTSILKWPVALVLIIVSFLLILYVEYEREIE